MFLNLIVKRLLQAKVQKNIINLNATTHTRLNSNKATEKTADDEIKSALDIEASLFDNSALQHAPVSTRETLRQLKIQNKPKSKKNYAATAKQTVVRQQQQVQPQQTNAQRSPRVAPPLIKDSELGLEFVRLSLQDPILSTLLTIVRSRKRRDKNSQIIIEGRRLISEALECGLIMETLIFSQRDQLALLSAQVGAAQRAQDTKIYKVPQHDLKTWSTLTTPPGLLAIFQRPTAESIELKQTAADATPPLPITVVCDNIREPNNLGSILRTCAALPCQQVVVTRGCCDPWESKALRGGCGAHFRLAIHDDVDWAQLDELIPADMHDDCHVFIAESNHTKLAHSTAETIDYAAVKETGAHNLVIIGGESHGVSDEAYNFLNTVGKRGKCIYIPLAAGIDSLNVTSALTLILFELRKKLGDE